MSNAIYLAVIAVLLGVLYVTYREEKRNRPARQYQVEEFWKGQDRREFKRIPKMLQIDYLYLSSDGKDLSKKEGKTKATSANVSWGGVQLILPEKLLNGTRLALEIQLEASRPPVRAVGEVVWMEEAPDKADPEGMRVFRTGVKFVGFSSEAQDRLIKFLYEESPS